MDYIDSVHQGYFYKLLQEKHLGKAMEVYKMLYLAVLCHQREVIVEWDEADEVLIPRFLFLLLADHPSLFYVRAEGSSFCYGEGYAKIRFRYGFSEQESWRIGEEIRRRVMGLTLVARDHGGIDPIEQMRYVYRYFVTRVVYAEEQLNSEDERELCCIHSAAGVLLEGKAVCDGLARAFKMILDELGIENRIIRKEIQSSAKFTHEWNVINLNGEELHADITWDMDVFRVQKQVLFEFFLLSEKEMQEKHQKGQNQACFKKREA